MTGLPCPAKDRLLHCSTNCVELGFSRPFYGRPMQLSLSTFSLLAMTVFCVSGVEAPATHSLQYWESLIKDKRTDGEHLIIYDFWRGHLFKQIQYTQKFSLEHDFNISPVKCWKSWSSTWTMSHIFFSFESTRMDLQSKCTSPSYPCTWNSSIGTLSLGYFPQRSFSELHKSKDRIVETIHPSVFYSDSVFTFLKELLAVINVKWAEQKGSILVPGYLERVVIILDISEASWAAVAKKKKVRHRVGVGYKGAVVWLGCQMLASWTRKGCRNMCTIYSPGCLLEHVMTSVFWAGPALSHNDTTNQRRKGTRWRRMDTEFRRVTSGSRHGSGIDLGQAT